ncbi:hypothetical protein [Kineosporia sp. R_H_3]|uniref:hypothetical protein n=1 Tax=Kineosporia sp. R_H_3 TaxID=1961848 RepID=UPI000B4ACD0D|nr:hypothetical protein [Kineosporia sp. R_H_3]
MTTTSTTTSAEPPAGAVRPLTERAAADLGRGRVRLTVEHLAVVAQRLAHGTVQPELAAYDADLVAAGVVGADGAVPAEVADLVATFAGPTLLAEVETSAAGEVVSHTVALRGTKAWSSEGWPGSALSEYVPFEATLLVPTLARLAGLRSLPAGVEPVTDREPLAVPVDVADRALAVAVAALAEPAGTAAAASGAVAAAVAELVGDPVAAQRFADLLAHLRLTWRVSVRSGDDVRAVAVLDTGALGLWLREEPAEPIGPQGVPPGAVLRLVPVSPGDAWRALVGLLPEPAAG